ncbi:hypothetical protein BDE02_06G177700 [Populus trichocarpa]|uniref:Transcription repressor n=1 Tax=Populus trichocarpa TaxID=3694 RepID=A0A3N7F455_POPTR|nr:hypothetical protein BDE02_06G177700 [Populus trichocarpa]
MSTNKKTFLLNTVSLNLGCSSCKKPKLSNICQPKPKPKPKPKLQTPTYQKHKKDLYCSSSSTSSSKITTNQSPNGHENHDTPNTFSPAMDTPPHFFSDTGNNMKCSTAVRGFGRVGGESVAVEKDSDDPYLDFRHSMLQMILEKEIYSKDDLRQLLDCFLQLNSPYYHGVIIRAFTEIWNGVFSMRTDTTSTERLDVERHSYS